VGAIELDASELSLEGEVPLIPTPTAEGDPTGTAITNSSCRKGADPQHAVHNFLFEGESAQVIGRIADATWLYVELPNDFGRCWIFSENLDLVGPISSLPLYTSPELPSTDDGGGDDDDGGGNDGGGNNDGGGGNNNSGSAPDAPSNANFQCGAGSDFTLSWNDNSDNEDGFRILLDGSQIGSVGANTTQFAHDPASSGPYSITIQAYNANGTGKTTLSNLGCLP